MKSIYFLPLFCLLISCGHPDGQTIDSSGSFEDQYEKKLKLIDCDISDIKKNQVTGIVVPGSDTRALESLSEGLGNVYAKSVEIGKCINSHSEKANRKGISECLNQLYALIMTKKILLENERIPKKFVPLFGNAYCYYSVNLSLLSKMQAAINDQSISFMDSYTKMYDLMKDSKESIDQRVRVINEELKIITTNANKDEN